MCFRQSRLSASKLVWPSRTSSCLGRGNLQGLLRHDTVVAERPYRPDPEFLELSVIRAHCLLRTDCAIGDLSHECDQLQRRFRKIDLTSEQCHAGTVAFRLTDQLESIARCPSATTKDSDDQFRVETS